MNSVSTAFELMRLELEAAVEELNSDGAALIQDSKYEEAAKLIETGRSLREFCNKVEQLAEEWSTIFCNSRTGGGFDAQSEEVARKILSASKSPRTGLLVRFPDGDLISEKTAALTLAKCIEKIGFQKVADLNIYVNSENIVSNSSSKKYNEIKLSRYFVKTHSSTAQKKRNLEQISDLLGLDLKVSVL